MGPTGGDRSRWRATWSTGQVVGPGVTDVLAGRGGPGERGAPVGDVGDLDVDFDAFVAARSDRLLRTAYLLTRDHALAEDL